MSTPIVLALVFVVGGLCCEWCSGELVWTINLVSIGISRQSNGTGPMPGQMDSDLFGVGCMHIPLRLMVLKHLPLGMIANNKLVDKAS